MIIALTILTTAVVRFICIASRRFIWRNTAMIIEPRKPKAAIERFDQHQFRQRSNYYNTQLKLLQNPDLMRDVVIRLGLSPRTEFAGQSKSRYSCDFSFDVFRRQKRTEERIFAADFNRKTPDRGKQRISCSDAAKKKNWPTAMPELCSAV